MRAGAAFCLFCPSLFFDYRHDVWDAAGSFGIQFLAAIAKAGSGGLLDLLESCRAGANGLDYSLSADSSAIADQR